MQRVAIARALANRPVLLLADEPTGELDAATGAEILSLFRRLNHDGTTLVVVTHDEQLAAEASRIIHMLDGRIRDHKP
jgi:putative ABC transport system ATP-binding protein